MSGLLPKGFDPARYLAEVRRQLHEETDYTREGAQLNRFAGFSAARAHSLFPGSMAI